MILIKILNSLKKLGAEAASFHTKTDNVIEVEPERSELGFVGIPNNISKFNSKQLLMKMDSIIAPLGIGMHNQTYNINGTAAASAITKKPKSELILMTNVEVFMMIRKRIREIKHDLENPKWRSYDTKNRKLC